MWGDPLKRKVEQPKEDRSRPSLASAPPAKPQLPTVSKNGYRYAIDPIKRTMHVRGALSLAPAARSTANQRKAGGSDRRPTDDGGHYIAARFNGPSDKFNHFAQDRNFNRGGYKAIENRWEKSLQSGRRVLVDITPRYHGQSQRPYAIEVRWTVDGKSYFQPFINEAEAKRGRR